MKFFLDHDVPAEVEQLLQFWKHDAQRLRDALPVTTPDAEVFAFAQTQQRIIVTCNRGHFLELAREAWTNQEPFAGLIILIRRRTRHWPCFGWAGGRRNPDVSGLPAAGRRVTPGPTPTAEVPRSRRTSTPKLVLVAIRLHRI